MIQAVIYRLNISSIIDNTDYKRADSKLLLGEHNLTNLDKYFTQFNEKLEIKDVRIIGNLWLQATGLPMIK